MPIYYNSDLTLFNSYHLKSKCVKAIFPTSEDEFIKYLKQSKPKIIIGNGNNIILSKEFYTEEFIILNGCFNNAIINGTEIIAEAGATSLQLSELALKNSLSGFEEFYDIPSSIGGAMVMNAGTSEGEIKDITIKVRYFDTLEKKIKEISKEKIYFGYRNSFFQKNKNHIILKAWFNLKKDNKIFIKKRMLEIKERRWSKQPRDYPNCGSVFKRPPNKFVGPMIEELGLKGFSIGGAKISEKHAGFIINYNNATGKDILELIHYIQQKIKEKFQIHLEIEQRII